MLGGQTQVPASGPNMAFALIVTSPPGKLTGMSEITEKLTLPDGCRSDHIVVQKVTTVANLGRVPCGASDEYR